MAVGIILGTIFVASGLGFLIARAVSAEVPDEIIIDVPPIDEIPDDEIEEIDVVIPGGAEVLITQIGL